VNDLYAYTDALYAQRPGDAVDVVVMRGTERVTVKVTLGRRN
jgi:S1-C subfamily serine protease